MLIKNLHDIEKIITKSIKNYDIINGESVGFDMI